MRRNPGPNEQISSSHLSSVKPVSERRPAVRIGPDCSTRVDLQLCNCEVPVTKMRMRTMYGTGVVF